MSFSESITERVNITILHQISVYFLLDWRDKHVAEKSGGDDEPSR